MPKWLGDSQAWSSSLPEESSASSVIRLKRTTAGVMLKGGEILQGNTLSSLLSQICSTENKSHRVRKHRAWEQESNPCFKDSSCLLCTTRGKKCISNPESRCQTWVLTCWVLLQLWYQVMPHLCGAFKYSYHKTEYGYFFTYQGLFTEPWVVQSWLNENCPQLLAFPKSFADHLRYFKWELCSLNISCY